MATINFVLRLSSRFGNYPGSLTLRIIHRRQVKNVALSDCHLYPHEWDKKTQTIIYPLNDHERTIFLKTVEQKIEYERALINGYITGLSRRGQYSADDIVCLFRKKSSNDKFLGYTEILAMELERNDRVRTARAYRTVSRGFLTFNKGEDIPLCQISSHLIKSFETYLKNKGKKPNTISYYMRNLRAIYNKAVTSGYVANTTGERPFLGVYTGNDKTRKRALTAEELKSLHSLNFSDMLKSGRYKPQEQKRVENLYFAWRLFFFCFYARGMCFVDLAYLRKSNIKEGVIKYCRKKTGQQVEVKITTELQIIIDSFATEVKFSNYVFPIIREEGKRESFQYENALRLQNRRLKALSKLAGIRYISTHVSRHTWATIGKRENIPIRIISECLGHSSEKTTLIYLGLLDNSLLDEANEIITSIITRPQTNATSATA